MDAFRAEVVTFLADSIERGVACPAYGAILSPSMVEPAVAWQRYCAEHGYAGIHWPVEYGGRGLSRAHSAVWYEECARMRVSPYLNLQGIILASEAILRSGTEEQKRDLLPPTLRADIIWCQLFSEPGSGSDLASLTTRATRDGDVFVVNGQKVWSSNAELAQWGILMARTDPDEAGHRGISFFCYDMSLPGTEVRPLRQMTGDAEFSEVFFTDVRMPADALVGELNGGWAVAMAVLADERGSFGSAGAISLDQRLQPLVAELADADPVRRDEIARLVCRGWALGAMLGRSDGQATMAPLAKLGRSELEFAIAGQDLDDLGPDGMLLDEPASADGTEAAARHHELVERFLYSPGMRIAGGSSEIQRSIIGERILGLPREPRV
ncbi:MAG: acyl-CoA dehydrogenase family protein [Acidimicrobiales bacterium]